MPKKVMPAHGNCKYPWRQWEDGQVHSAQRGRHFRITPASFRKSLSVRAIRRGKRVVTSVSKGTVTFQFLNLKNNKK